MVDDALGVAVVGTRHAEVVTAEHGDRQLPVVVAANVCERAPEQLELGVRHALVQPPVDLVDVDARGDQVRRHQMRARPGVLVHELAGVGDDGDIEGLGDLPRRVHAERVHQIPDDLGRARGVGDHHVDVAEARVVVVVVEVEDARAVALDDLDGVAVDVAAVEEDHDALVEVLGRQRDEPVEREEAVLVGQRQLLRGHEHQ